MRVRECDWGVRGVEGWREREEERMHQGAISSALD